MTETPCSKLEVQPVHCERHAYFGGECKDCTIERLTRELDAAEERSKACDQIADGDYGWENLRTLCVATMSVCRLRSNYERLRAALKQVHAIQQDQVMQYDEKLQQIGRICYGVLIGAADETTEQRACFASGVGGMCRLPYGHSGRHEFL